MKLTEAQINVLRNTPFKKLMCDSETLENFFDTIESLQKELEEKSKVVCVVVKNGKVDNSHICDTVAEGIDHANNMIRDYRGENVSQIVVIKQNADGMNEKCLNSFRKNENARMSSEGVYPVMETEFRGLSMDGKLVFGDLVKHRLPGGAAVLIEYRDQDGKHYLISVKPETVGAYTGRKDIHGKKIFEHDVIKDKYGISFVVLLDDFENRYMGVEFPDAIWNERQGDVRFIRDCSIEEYGLYVTETIFDNLEYQEIKKCFDEEGR